jgi:hypothetical protein
MHRRVFILAAALLASMQPFVMAQQTALPGPADLKTVLQDDARFGQLMTEVWVLRDILALHLGNNISAEAQEFQGLQDRMREQRAAILEKVTDEPFPQTTIASADRFAATLELTGVQRNSELGKRLVLASILFEQAARLGSLGSLCDLHPFRAVCSPS